MRQVLVVVDYQNEFVTGALANPAAQALEQGIVQKVQAVLAVGGRVLFTRDTHGEDYLSTREGRFLPVPHCVRGTQGWQLYGALHAYEQAAPQEGVAFLDKPTFGAEGLPAAVKALCGGEPDMIEVCGVVTDICVVSNCIVLHTAFLNAQVRVCAGLCAAGTPEGHRRALEVLAGMGYEVV